MKGTIQNKGRGKWMIRVYLGRDEEGRTIHFNKTVQGSRKAAQQILQARIEDHDRKKLTRPTSRKLANYLESWLINTVQKRVRSSSFESYRMIVRTYLKVPIGRMDIKQLTAPDVQNVYDSMLQRGLSNRTVRYTHSVLSSAMNELVKKGAIKVNPCLQTVLPKRSRKEIRHMSPDQACVFLKATRPDRFSVLFRLALETGMRPEEYLALQWKDIDFKHSFLSVRRAISWSRDDGKYEFIEPKTVRSRRRIPLSASMVSALQKHRSFQAQENDRHIDLNLVFPSARGTPVQPRNLRNRHFFPILEKAGLERFRLYDLRHTMATLMLAAGENPKVVSERLGHASIVITLDTYSHVLPTLQREATDRLAKILASPRFRASS